MTGAALRYLLQRRADVPDLHGWLAPAEAEKLATLSVPARRAAWLLGRWTAKRAVQAVLEPLGQGREHREIEVRAAADGAPEVWLGGARAPLSLSLSHRAGEALALVGPASLAVGGDLEVVEARSPGFVADFFAAEERAAWEAAAPEARDALAALTWSAKESALKVLRDGLRRDTREVVAALGAAVDAAGWGRVTARVEGRGSLAGFYRRDGDRVITLVASAPTERPAPL